MDHVHDVDRAGGPSIADPGSPGGRGGRRRPPLANVPLHHAALDPSFYRARSAAGVAVHRAELRHHLHDHPGRSGRGTTNLPFKLYLEAFQAFDIGRASAIGVLAVILTMI